MLKLYISIVLVTFGLLCSSEEIVDNTTKVVVNETVDATTELTDNSNSVNADSHNLTMFAKKESNLIVNGSAMSVGRNIKPEIGTVASTNVMAVVVVAVVVALCLVGAVVGAIYVKKRRLFVWNLAGKKSDGQDGANGVLTNASSENGSVNKCEGVMDTKTEVVNETETKNEATESEQKKEEATNLNEQQKASSSLVVNVLNELNECNKEENKTPSSTQADPEKQPLKNE